MSEHPEKDPRQTFVELVNDVKGYLRYKQEEGAATIELNRPLPPPAVVAEPAPARPLPPAAPSRPAPPREEAGSLTAPASDVGDALRDIASRVAACTKCELCKTRTKTVPGQGAMAPEIMFVGEGPGADEDKQGLAFVGRAGQLLTKIIEAMGFTRDQVFIGNIVKCRPPENRTPHPDEMQSCLPYLREQIALLKPKVIVALGATAVKGLLDVQTGITKLRGTWLSYENVDLMPTYHPAYLLRNPAGKKEVWEDMKSVLARLGKSPPPRGK